MNAGISESNSDFTLFRSPSLYRVTVTQANDGSSAYCRGNIDEYEQKTVQVKDCGASLGTYLFSTSKEDFPNDGEYEDNWLIYRGGM